MAIDYPFEIVRDQITVKGGCVKGEVITKVKTVDGAQGKEFAILGYGNRGLARNFGLGMEQTNPWSAISLVEMPQTLRDDKVDEIIREHVKNMDPMADSGAPVSDLPMCGREKSFL